MATLFLFGLIVSYSLVEHAAMDILIEYLTSTDEYENLPKAATIINLMAGSSTIIAVIFSAIADSFIGGFKMVFISTLMYIAGLVLLFFSAKDDRNSEYYRYSYAGAVVVTLGKSGLDSSLRAFLADQMCKRDPPRPNRDEERIEDRTKVWWQTAWFSGSVISLFWLANVEWEKKFKISALVMGASLLVFLCGFMFYYYRPLIENALGMILKVFKVAISKRRRGYPHAEGEFNWGGAPRLYYQNNNGQILLLPKVRYLKWLDKAAIIDPQGANSGNFCLVEQVTDVKRLLTLIPMWATFFVYSLVEATGSTFFIEQTSNLDDKITHNIKVPIVAFFVLTSFTRFVVQLLFWIFWSKKANEQHVSRVRIGVGMVCSILCCFAAWQVEVHRLEKVDAEYPNDTMSVLWLAPQFFFLGLMEGFASEGLEVLFDNHVKTESMKRNGVLFTDCIIGFGNFFSIPFVLLKRDWFMDTINESHLDRYFLTLAISSSVFLCFNLFVAFMLYAHKEDSSDDSLVVTAQNTEMDPF